MLLILLNWIIITFICFTTGFVVRRFFVPDTNSSEIAVTVVWGLFVISLLSTLFMFFIPAGDFLLLLFFLTATIIQFFSREEIGKRFNLFRITVAGRREAVAGGVLLFALLLLSAQPSKINDDGYYYIQTMMWFTREGFVNGISNLLMPLGLGSSWHVLQALFSFNFVEGMRFNDLNGFLVFIFFIFCLENGLHGRQNLLLALLLAFTLLISFPFLSAPSPDLPVIVFTGMAFYLLSRPFGSRTVSDILIIAAFAVSIKLSAVALALLALALIVYALFRRLPVHEGIYFLLFLCAATLAARNIFQTGYPLYPWPWLGAPDLSWATPPELLQHYTAGIKYWGLEGKVYRGPISEWRNPGLAETLLKLLEGRGYKGVLNTFILLSFPLFLFTVAHDIWQRVKARSIPVPLIILHGVFLLNFLLWLILAPQYRFILPVYVFYCAWLLVKWLKPLSGRPFLEKAMLLPYVSIAILLVLSLVPVSVDTKSTSTHIGTTDGFSAERVIRPHVSYTFAGLDTLEVGGARYYHVKRNLYCWDSPLPCMSQRYHNFLQRQGYELVKRERRGRVEFGLRK